MAVKKAVLYILAWIFVGLGIIGAFLPIMPTVPFMIVAAWLFSKSSPKLHQWILDRPNVGPIVHEWEQHGVIRRHAKVKSTILIVLGFGCSMAFFKIPDFMMIGLPLIGVATLSFIWSRKETKDPSAVSSKNSVQILF